MKSPRRLRRQDFALLLLATVASLSNYAPLMSVVPLWVASGGQTGTGVGATTAVMMGATAATQLAMRPVFRLLSLRRMLTSGALLMAVATPFYALSSALGPVLVVSAVRGVGFALVVVAGSALVADIVPAQKLARGAGVYGLAAGLPNLVALPLGVWAVQHWSFLPVFVVCSVLALAAVPIASGMRSGGDAGAPSPAPATENAGGSLRPMLRPSMVFFATTMALGGVMTFLPLALAAPAAASTALFALALCMIAGRVGAGTIGDRIGAGRLLLPGAVMCALGILGVAFAVAGDSGALRAGVVTALGAGLFGLGLGAVQNDSLIVILNRAGPGRHGTASVVWNFAYDGGTGAGAVLFGIVVGGASYAWAFGVGAAAIALTVPATLRSGPRG